VAKYYFQGSNEADAMDRDENKNNEEGNAEI
jgi:hypothetical protein